MPDLLPPQRKDPAVTNLLLINLPLVLAILCLAIAAGCWCAEDLDEGVFGATLFLGIAGLLAWLALR
jgi:hypothetical protein